MTLSRGRHVGYGSLRSDGTRPVIIAEMPHFGCLDFAQQIYDAHHVGYGASSGRPLLAVPLTCCRAYTSERVAHGCYPGGLTRYIGLTVTDVGGGCAPFVQHYVLMEWAAGCSCTTGGGEGCGCWTASVVLRNGTLSYCLQAEPTYVDGSGRTHYPFSLHWQGCNPTISGSDTSESACVEPWRLELAQYPYGECCACCQPGAAFTATLEANCLPVLRGRHVGYTNASEADRLPIVVATPSCGGGRPGWSCIDCQLVATGSGCGCLDGTYDLVPTGSGWEGFPPCGHVRLTCEDVLDEHGLATTGQVRLCVYVVCNADQAGDGCIVIPIEDMASPHVVFPIVMGTTGAPTCDPPSCVYSWSEMVGWTRIVDCGAGCSCEEPIAPGTSEGQTTTTPCTPVLPPLCCDPDTVYTLTITRSDGGCTGGVPVSATWGGGPATPTTPATWPMAKRAPTPALPPQHGPGTELTHILEELGFRAGAGCACKALATRMNEWGVDGCQARRQEILSHLRQSRLEAGWMARAAAAARAVWSGLAWKLDPRDPESGLLDEALRRAREKEARDSGHVV